MPEVQKRIKALESEAADCDSLAAVATDQKVAAYNSELARSLRLKVTKLKGYLH